MRGVGAEAQPRHQPSRGATDAPGTMVGVRVILIAPPGAGKGTQGERIAARYGIPHVSSGELFRAEIARSSEIGEQVRSHIDKGELVPDELVVELLQEPFLSVVGKGGGYVLDGFPRTLAQAETAAGLARELGLVAHAVVALDAPRAVLTDRLMARGQGRADDNERTIERRLAVYDEQTAPLLDYYAGRSLLHRVDASRPVDEVSETIFAVLDAVAREA